MNPYLRLGGRLVGVVVLAAGVCFVPLGAWFILEAIAHWPDWYGYRWSPFHVVALGFICEVLAIMCFRYCSRLKREERKGIQI